MLAGWLTAQVQRLLCFELHNVFVIFLSVLTTELLTLVVVVVVCIVLWLA